MKRLARLAPAPFAFLLLAAGPATPADGPAFRTLADDPWCHDVHRDHHGQPTWCEVREATLPAAGPLTIDAAPNGAVSAKGTDRRDVGLRVMVVARAASEAEARALAQQVRVETGAALRAVGPSATGRSAWWASFEASVPRHSDLALSSVNGPLSLAGVEGSATLTTENGPVTVTDAAGRVKGRTTNGPVTVRLAGTAWSGEGLDVETVNGPVALAVPADYNARLEAGTVNGPLDLGFPVTVQGRARHDVSATLGAGGALVRARTTNGPLSLRRP